MKISFVQFSYRPLIQVNFILFFIFSCYTPLKACQCPLTVLSLEECNKYEIIFKGKILSVANCDHKFGEAIFEVEELYKGVATQEFKVLFDCNEECMQKFSVGDEWIIYSRYKQVDNAKMDWCSRSRKFFKVDKEDFYTVTYGNDYFDEVQFLQKTLGVHRVSVIKKSQSGGRNKRPDTQLMVIILISSLATIVLFYYLFNKFFK
ncbi:hypothetical protein CNR22_11865 [Sphingobacteriaceae bacterium]|nr:hypothetical protein CNR22_11865 [Sphingobacteriaceae bacterium]